MATCAPLRFLGLLTNCYRLVMARRPGSAEQHRFSLLGVVLGPSPQIEQEHNLDQGGALGTWYDSGQGKATSEVSVVGL